MLEKVRAFDKNGVIKIEIDSAMRLLKDFRARYPFAESPEAIETLEPNDIFKEQSKEVGEFFHWLEYYLKPIGHLRFYGSNVYRQIRNQFEDFKERARYMTDVSGTIMLFLKDDSSLSLPSFTTQHQPQRLRFPRL